MSILLRSLRLLVILTCFFGSAQLWAQALEGTVRDGGGNPVPYANLFVEELATGTSSDDLGAYYLKLPVRGDYRIIVSAVGYTSTVDTVILADERVQYDFTLHAAAADLKEIVVEASKRDPAYAIIRKASERRQENLRAAASYRAQVYLKAREDVEQLEGSKRQQRKAARQEQARLAELEESGLPEDPIAVQQREQEALLGKLNLVESQFTLNFLAPNHYKEERLAYKSSGSKTGLFVPIFGDGDFNFYRAQVDFGSLADNNMISPLAPTAVLAYKFKLLETTLEGSDLIYKIRITPRKAGNSTLSGLIYITDRTYSINRVEVSLPKGALKFLDELNFEQEYGLIRDSIWLPTRQVFDYQTKQGKRKNFRGRTTLRYTDYELDYPFEERFFGGELAVTTAEAYKRDTAYWRSARLIPLEQDEAEVVRIRDSIFQRVNSVEYKDSVDAAYNNVQFLDVLWDGVGFRDHRRQEHLWFGPLPAWIEFDVVGGFRLGPYVSYSRRFTDGTRIYTDINGNIGLSNEDVQGQVSVSYRYAPKRLGDVWANGGRAYESINDFDAFLNQLRRSNYILVDRYRAGHRIEVVNGLFSYVEAGFAERQPAPAVNTQTFLSDIIDDEAPIPFEAYQTFWTDLGLYFTPFQKYLTEPLQKVILGSKWPTVGIRHKRGWSGAFGSDVDYDYIELSLKQTVALGVFGTSRYRIEAGEFINDKDLRFVDLKRFRQSDPLLLSSPLRSFQLLDTSLSTTKPFIEFHANHHFNGALTNNLPLIRQTRVELVAGGGFLYLTENNYRHEELFVGLERVFKLGVRRRLRLGVYGVVANSSTFPQDETIKVSLDVIDTWKKDWSF